MKNSNDESKQPLAYCDKLCETHKLFFGSNLTDIVAECFTRGCVVENVILTLCQPQKRQITTATLDSHLTCMIHVKLSYPPVLFFANN